MEFEKSPLALYGVAAGIFVVLLLLRKVFLTLTDPLRSIPGPFYSRLTSYGLARQVFRGHRFHHVHGIHQKYGPIARIAPNEVSVADPATVKHIHSIGTSFQKTGWYQKRTGMDQVVLFTEPDPHRHAQLKKQLANAISETSLSTSFEGIVKEKVDLWNEKVQADLASQGWSDFSKWDTYLATDTIGELTFGSSFDTLKIGKKTQYFLDMEDGQRMRNIVSFVPFVRRLASTVRVGILKEVTDLNARLMTYATDSIQRHRTFVAANPDNHTPTLFSKLYALNEKDDGSEATMSDAYLAAEARSYIIAGTDTTSVSLTYLFWELGRHPDLQARLSAEMNALPPDYTSKELRTAVLLNQVVNEALRLHGAAASGLPRCVPPGGATLCGFDLPAGTTVSTQSFTLHRDPAVFDDPERFRPERWAEPTPAMKDAFQPFGLGSRSCLGKSLALLELRHAVAAMYRARPAGLAVAYGVRDDERARGMSDEDMEMQDYFVTRLKGRRCLLRARA